VVPPAPLQDLAPSAHATGLSRPDTKVNIGIFPASVTHLRPGAINDDGTLADAFAQAVQQAEETATANGHGVIPPWSRELEGVKEEDEEVEGYSVASPGIDGIKRGEIIDVFSSPKSPTPKSNSRPRPRSLLVDPSRQTLHSHKAQPPVPTITAGDSTVAGQVWPLVDEIACAIREWHEVSRWCRSLCLFCCRS
jgi:dedicator of cytokinesis protein 3